MYGDKWATLKLQKYEPTSKQGDPENRLESIIQSCNEIRNCRSAVLLWQEIGSASKSPPPGAFFSAIQNDPEIWKTIEDSCFESKSVTSGRFLNHIQNLPLIN
jgi:hypothetical protein